MFDRGIIISIQPTQGSIFDSIPLICDFARASEAAGAIAIKIEGLVKIDAVRQVVKIPIIGIVKTRLKADGRPGRITYTNELLASLFISGADYVGTESLKVIDSTVAANRQRIIFEADSFETSKVAASFGVAAIATTLFGYTPGTEERFSPDPDLAAVKELAEALSTPIIAEGRFSKLEDVTKAVRLGAHSVCIGTAVTRPDIIIAQYVKGFGLEAPIYRS